MYGSSESQRLRTRNCPSPGCGTGDSTSLKFASVTQPSGRLARRIWRLTGIVACPASRALVGGEALGVPVAVAEPEVDHRQPLREMRGGQLVGHAHAAVQLDRFFRDCAARASDQRLRRRDRARALASVLRLAL